MVSHAARHGVTSLFGMISAIEVGVLVLLPILGAVQQFLENFILLEVIRGSDLDAALAVMAWKTM